MARPWLDVTSFDAATTPRDGIHDWTMTIQAAVDLILKQNITQPKLNAPLPVNDVSGTLYFPPGKYKITKPIRIFNIQGSGSDQHFEPCSIELMGDATALGATEGGSIILPSFVSSPAIVIQRGQAVRLRKLVIQGRNDWTRLQNPLLAVNHYNDANYVVNGCRAFGDSPYAGICIDPFGSFVDTIFPGAGYPDFVNDYRNPLPSSGVLIQDCFISGFVVGICVSPGGITGSASSNDLALSVIDSQIESTESRPPDLPVG